MCQSSLISQKVVQLSRRSYNLRLVVVVPKCYDKLQLGRLNRQLDNLYELIYDDWRTITEEDYEVFGGQFEILIQTLKQLYNSCRRLPKELGVGDEVKKLGMNYSALYELNSDIVNFCIKLPKNQEVKQLMKRLDVVDKKIKTDK